MKKVFQNYFLNGEPVHYDIKVDGTPSVLKMNGLGFYGEVTYFNPYSKSNVIIWFSSKYDSPQEAFNACYEKMKEYIETNPILEIE